ncbi:MAG TPA: iron-sulfur cluster insertion protein ErpA [Gaiellaceae bacterium]|nr:iron-sulfur cluster insertion protein ErpA [Gaiellaceae bacterium]
MQRLLQVGPFEQGGDLGGGWYDGRVEIAERTDELIVLTESAAAKIKGLMAEEPEGESSVLRVAVQGGGCSGFEYALGFDQGAQEGDYELETQGVTVVVDPFSAPYLRGAEIDYLETIQESGFKISNPNATSACGCGHSFQVAEGEAPEDSGPPCGSGCSH